MPETGFFNATPRLEEQRVPTLIITGERETTIPQKNQQILVEGIQDATHAKIQGARHIAIADQPDKFNDSMLAFLS